MTSHTVLVLTAPVDPTADYVVTALRRRGVRVARFDTASFPAEAGFSAQIGTGGNHVPGWDVVLRPDDGPAITLDEVGAVYYRRPGRFAFSDDVSAAHLPWCEGQARYGLWGVLESLPVAWVNFPPAVAAGEYKPRQLAVAAELGLPVPDTLITNEPVRAEQFVAEHPGGVVTKALYSRGPRDEDGRITTVLYTSLVPPHEAGDASIGLTAHLFQAFVAKAYDVRVTVVDGCLFAAAIDDADPANVVDWRRSHHGLSYRTCEMPAPVASAVRALVRRLGLRFAALDFVVHRDTGEWIFIEVNPNGQWAWVESATGLPIADALTQALTASAPDWIPSPAPVPLHPAASPARSAP